MGKQAKIMVQLLILLVIIVISSAVILTLVKYGVLTPKESDVQILNTEFIPVREEAVFTLEEFKFCAYIDEDFNCLDARDVFERGQEVYAHFIITSSTSNGEIFFNRNYRLKDSQDNLIFDFDSGNTYQFSMMSTNTDEQIVTGDLIPTFTSYPTGVYSLDLVVENPLLNKQFTITRQFTLEPNFPEDLFE
jgi:hypothetical protein